MLVKIIDELNEQDTYDKYQENIIEENVKRISGKKGDNLKQDILKLYP